jgi:SAM-dependent methyltransferase
MEKQKKVQKEWYENKSAPKGSEIIEISTLTHIKKLQELLPVRNVRISLNCGCGDGGQRDIFGPSIGVDISFENIRALVKEGGQGVVADMEFLPFKDHVFDLVYGFGILHHLSDIRNGVSEASRVLEKGGYVGFGGENNGLCPFVYIMSFLYRNWRIEKGSYRIRKGNLRKIFRESGIIDFKVSKWGMTIYGMGRALYKLTSFVDGLLSRFRLLNAFSGYCYIAGKKI